MEPYLDFVSDLAATVGAYPYLLMVAFAVPFGLLAAIKVYPSARLMILLCLCSLSTFTVLIQPLALLLVVVLDLVVIGVAITDLMTVCIPVVRAYFGNHSITAERSTTRTVSLGKPHRVSLTLLNHGRRSISLLVKDDVPQEFTAEPEEFKLRLAPQSRTTVHYDLEASTRGAFDLEVVHIRTSSTLGLWKRMLKLPVPTRINVYPDLKQMAEYALLARTNRLSLLGVRRTRKVGQDNEFERLRDYTPDDNYRFIDWRATARRSKLTVKDFQTNQSQRIIFLLDCGRMMTNEAAGISMLDHSLNAMLMLSFVALSQGDSVGFISFSDTVHDFVPPKSGKKQMNQILHGVYDRFPTLVESRYDQAFRYLSTHCRKRSLVVLITNVIDEVNSNQIQQYLSNISGKHLPLGVLLRDRRVFEAVDDYEQEHDDIFLAGAAAEILAWRQQVITDMEHNGVLAVDAFPEDMTAKLLNQYLEVKARHLL
jgi:uncharacterized protein (DUF58 family)